jgi:hypothetical protein
MMERDNVIREFDTLPPEAQRQVLDFIAFLQTRYQPTVKERSKTKTSIAEENFVGIWRNRANMQDSSSWVREIRSTEWGNSE